MRDNGTLALVLVIASLVIVATVAYAQFHMRTGRW